MIVSGLRPGFVIVNVIEADMGNSNTRSYIIMLSPPFCFDFPPVSYFVFLVHYSALHVPKRKSLSFFHVPPPYPAPLTEGT